MQILGIIPARYASTRFPGKPLVDIGGKSMIQRVYEQAKKCVSISEVVVATDDDRIFDHVHAFGGKAVMTSAEHQSGTDRCAEVAILHPEYDVIINIQGDEPYIDPEQLTKVATCFTDPETQLATLIKKVLTEEELHNVNSPKVIINRFAEAIYFSRSPLPHIRGQQPANWLQHFTYFKHIGVYGYRADILQQITKLPISSLEKAESLEQLRWIENGYRIKVAETELETHAIDTPEDLLKLKV
ncbi:3-deoxy-manno-octulosonate cytidylyltransferase [Mucilaginibacter polytrichastri]|uniref:3-deoxy-manno-octulosonate cytidylyltransferase n=1 Tax=Mucilaginibacter polytrichastri TaxID=1302689 RepID=A0A1Q5ZUR1_9SPHI|nr:3-deoxy-manno-octulosonate cytidylyltransferase [Mucilaginibacter polytrichastri]OKS85500.1 3-deoxy-manno-octulosonate cytidylyltransferase [Mucilaginibacter polytrichastri]SFS37720.1 3-deoxy-manno-octulosonate cytidylyltransferase (CMP-KDO synthetase) [Mucilaginibacter polytrichastri]